MEEVTDFDFKYDR